MRDVEPILAELGFAEHYYALCERFPIDLHSDFRTLCEALTQLRRAIADAEWHVHVDDADIPWDRGRRRYDPFLGAR